MGALWSNMERGIRGSNTVEVCHQQSPGLEKPQLKEQIAKAWITRFCDIWRVGGREPGRWWLLAPSTPPVLAKVV